MSHLIDHLNKDEIAYITFTEYEDVMENREDLGSPHEFYQYEIKFTIYAESGDKERYKQFSDRDEYELEKGYILRSISGDERFYVAKSDRRRLRGFDSDFNRKNYEYTYISIGSQLADFIHACY